MFDLFQDQEQREQSVFSMRLDEYKKKQCVDYKKKYGIFNKKIVLKEKYEVVKILNVIEIQEGDDLGNISKVCSQFVVEFFKLYKEV